MAQDIQKKRVLNWLTTQGELTVRDAVVELGIMSLPRRIMELRQEGFEIVTEYKKSKNGARYGVYYLLYDPTGDDMVEDRSDMDWLYAAE